MNRFEISSGLDIEKLKEASQGKPVLVFKHSTTCPISSTALSRVERNWSDLDGLVEFYYLDLLANRSISNALAEEFGIEHQSPQVLLIKNGKCVYDASHFGIRAGEIASQILNDE